MLVGPLAVEVSLERGTYEVAEGMMVSVCINLSNEIERNVFVSLTTSSDSSSLTASGTYFRNTV